jgi:diaminopimelate decarboxylase
MDRVLALVARHYGTVRGELRIGDLPIRAIAAEHGTPVYVYDAATLDRQWQRLRDVLPADFEICYSVKANPNPAILGRFLARGCGLEIASAGEFHYAMRAGCPPERMLFAGPGKTDTELEIVLKHHIGEIHAESLHEIERILAIAGRLAHRAPVAVRVNPGEAARGGAMQMGGKPSPFGIDEERLDEAVDRLASASTAEFRGLHLFSGTQILDAEVLLRQYRKGFAIAERVGARLGRALSTVDFGGGLGIPYFPGEGVLDLERVRAGVAELATEFRGRPAFAGTRFVVEPGRYLVGESGLFVTTVLDVKVSRGKTFVVIDGGMNHHLAASGNLGQVIKRNWPMALVNKLDREPTQVVDVVGPLCTPLDTLARDVRLPAPDVGDLLAVFQSGAYARSASPLGFLSHPAPPEVLVDAGVLRLVRRRGCTDDLFADLVGADAPAYERSRPSPGPA